MKTLSAQEENTRQAERGIVAAILVSPIVSEEAAFYLSRSTFFDSTLGRLFELLSDAWESKQWNGGMSTLVPILRAAKILDALGGVAELARLTAEGLPHNARFFAQEVQRYATLRRMGLELLKASEECKDPSADPVALAGRIEALATIGQNVADDVAIPNLKLIEDAWTEIEKSQACGQGQGIKTGLPSLDGEAGAFFPSEVTILAARPSMGKTATAMEIAYRLARSNQRILFVSLEMGSVQLGYRLLCRATGIPVRRIQSGTLTDAEMLSLRIAKEQLSAFRMLNIVATHVTVPEVKARARIVDSIEPLDLIVIDYLGLMSTKQPLQTYERVTQISRHIKSMANAMQKPLLVLHQLNRAGDGKPTLENLRDSGAIEQDADNVWLIHRESRESEDMEIIVAKQRQGQVGSVQLKFHGRLMRVDEPGATDSIGSEEFGRDFNDFA